MKARYLGDALKANTSSPLLSFLAPSINPLASCHPSSRLALALPKRTLPTRPIRCRNFTALSHHQAATAAAARQEEEEPEEEEEPSSSAQPLQEPTTPAQSNKSSRRDELNKALSSLTPFPQPPPNYYDPTDFSPSSFDAAQQSDVHSRSPTRRGQAAAAPKHYYDNNTNPDPHQDPSDLFGKMKVPGGQTLFDSHELARGVANSIRAHPLGETPKPFRLDAFIGRGVNMTGRNMGLGEAIRQMEIKAARNRVRKESQQQRFHEREGLKRKRLKSERWRRRFKEGFREVCAKVERMRKQGW